MAKVNNENKPDEFPQQRQSQPGKEYKMDPQPLIIRDNYKGSGKLEGKIALITGGDSGIGRSAAVHFAREGADLSIIYHKSDKDAEATRDMIEKEGRKCLLVKGDLREQDFCKTAVARTVAEYGSLNIVVNNAGEQHDAKSLEEIDFRNTESTFKTDVFAVFYITQFALEYLHEGDCIINNTSITAFRGSPHLIDYSAAKGALTSFTRSLAVNLAKRKIRVNAIAPGPIWTPLIPATFDNVEDFGKKTALGRAGQPSEVGPAFVFLASEDASFMTGETVHINGGDYVSG